MKKPLIIMIHRVECDDSSIDNLYYQRNMVIKIDKLIELINEIIKSKFSFGTITESIDTRKNLHITFDDGYKEHLTVAKILKKEYRSVGLKKENCSFAINIGNSFLHEFSGMDLIYNIIKNNSIEELCSYLSINNQKNCNLDLLKKIYIKMNISEIEEIKNSFKYNFEILKNQFLNQKEVIELSKLFNIISHGVYHRDLRYHKKSSKREVLISKKHLENLGIKPIDVFCYPEGKSNKNVRQICKDSGYKFGLSINHVPNNPYKIGRYCINKNIAKILRKLKDA